MHCVQLRLPPLRVQAQLTFTSCTFFHFVVVQLFRSLVLATLLLVLSRFGPRSPLHSNTSTPSPGDWVRATAFALDPFTFVQRSLVQRNAQPLVPLASLFGSLVILVFAMSRSSNSFGGQHERPLDYMDEKVPPGWAPGIPNYRFVDYEAKLDLWLMRYRIAGNDGNQEGLAVASRLQGAPWKLAMKMRLPKLVQDGGPRVDGPGGDEPPERVPVGRKQARIRG